MKAAMDWQEDIAQAVDAKCSINEMWHGLNEEFQQDAMIALLEAYRNNPAINDGLVRHLIHCSIVQSIADFAGIPKQTYSDYKHGRSDHEMKLCIQGRIGMVRVEEFDDMPDVGRLDFSGLRYYIDCSSTPEVLRLSYFDDLNDQQISDRMRSKGGMCKKTVGTRRRKALAEMKAAMLADDLSLADFIR